MFDSFGFNYPEVDVSERECYVGSPGLSVHFQAIETCTFAIEHSSRLLLPLA